MDDGEAIKQLKARYFRYVDTKDWVGWEDVFTEDAKMDFDFSALPGATGGEGLQSVLGRRTIIDQAKSFIGDALTIHHGFMPEIEITGPSEAKGIWAMEDRLSWPTGQKIHGFGYYHESYRKGDDGRWRIASILIVRTHIEQS